MSELVGPAGDALFSYFSPIQLHNFSLTSRPNYYAVHQYCRHAFSLHRLLKDYFSESETLAFRYTQAQTGTIISGSTALQFFERRRWKESDLDLYVEHRHAKPMAHWLMRTGWKCDPKELLALDKEILAEEAAEAATTARDTGERPSIAAPPPDVRSAIGTIFFQAEKYKGIAKVFTFTRKENRGRKIQLITAYNSVLELILQFHSTCVMNIIAHDRAYAFYPHATYEEYLSLSVNADNNPYEPPLSKYRQRGWESFTITELPPSASIEPSGDFYLGTTHRPASGFRYLGDARTWAMDIYPALPGVEPNLLEGFDSWFTPGIRESWGWADKRIVRYLAASNLKYAHMLATTKVEMFLGPILKSLEEKDAETKPSIKRDKDMMNLLKLYYKTSDAEI